MIGDQVMRPDHNLTGKQRTKILDGLIYLGIEAIFRTTRFIEPHLVSLISWSIRNKRRKISNASKDVQVSLLANAILTNDAEYKLRALMAFKPDRYIPIGYLRLFLKAVDGYCTASREEQQVIEASIKCHAPKQLYGAIMTVEDSLRLALEFRNTIVAEYYNLCRQEAGRLKRKSAIPIQEHDLTQNLCNGVMVAIDKYNHDNGALTSYIRPWFRYLSQSPKYSHEEGLAYDIPYNYRMTIAKQGRSNIGSSIDEVVENGFHDGHDPTEDEAQDTQQTRMLLRLMQIADPKGLVRLGLGTEEYMSDGIKKQMIRQIAQQGTGVLKKPVGGYPKPVQVKTSLDIPESIEDDGSVKCGSTRVVAPRMEVVDL